MAEKKTTELFGKLQNIQGKLVAPKGQTNKFGGYKYRSCEDILEAVKPLLEEEGLTLLLQDELVLIGERYYIKATAVLRDAEDGITVCAYAREEAVKKGMDGSQITGAASSYARKYALNGMFLIDDTKDSDHTNTGQDSKNVIAPPPKKVKEEDDLSFSMSVADATNLAKLYTKKGVSINDVRTVARTIWEGKGGSPPTTISISKMPAIVYKEVVSRLETREDVVFPEQGEAEEVATDE